MILMMRVVALYGAMLFLLALDASARLGETRQECDRRYGRPIQVLADTNLPGAVYEMKGFRIWIFLMNDRVHGIVYKKPDKTIPELHIALSEIEIKRFLQVNSQGSEWEEADRSTQILEAIDAGEKLKSTQLIRKAVTTISFVRRDIKACALYNRINHSLMIMTTRFVLEKEKGLNNLDGF